MGTLAAQTIFADRYKILAHLGTGGMGHVYRAEHLFLAKHVALKVLGKRTPEYLARFEREARAIARLDHPGCVRILDHGADDKGRPYIVMELVDGPTLALALADDAFAVQRALNVTRALLVALAHAHAHGVVHRDLKPENIMFAGTRPVIIDFGLASLADAAGITGNGFAMGSPSYIAPERLRGEPHDARADLYGVGVILYEMLSGLRPFLGANPQEIMTNALTRPPRPLRAIVPDVSPALDALIRRALAKDPAKRFADAEEMLSALDDVIAFDAISEVASEPAPYDPAASITFAQLVVPRPSVLARLWGWLRYGAWRWRGEVTQ